VLGSDREIRVIWGIVPSTLNLANIILYVGKRKNERRKSTRLCSASPFFSEWIEVGYKSILTRWGPVLL
jgi:hypothetical protein